MSTGEMQPKCEKCGARLIGAMFFQMECPNMCDNPLNLDSSPKKTEKPIDPWMLISDFLANTREPVTLNDMRRARHELVVEYNTYKKSQVKASREQT